MYTVNQTSLTATNGKPHPVLHLLHSFSKPLMGLWDSVAYSSAWSLLCCWGVWGRKNKKARGGGGRASQSKYKRGQSVERFREDFGNVDL